jgi:hypothetical protein
VWFQAPIIGNSSHTAASSNVPAAPAAPSSSVTTAPTTPIATTTTSAAAVSGAEANFASSSTNAATADAAAAAAAVVPPKYEGPVKKRGEKAGSKFNMRHFVLRDSCIEYFASKNGRKKGEILLGPTSTVVRLGDDGFTVASASDGNRLYECEVKNKTMRDAWVDAVTDAVAQLSIVAEGAVPTAPPAASVSVAPAAVIVVTAPAAPVAPAAAHVSSAGQEKHVQLPLTPSAAAEAK